MLFQCDDMRRLLSVPAAGKAIGLGIWQLGVEPNTDFNYKSAAAGFKSAKLSEQRQK
jgi:hypothetical protein